MQTGQEKLGMQTMNQSLAQLVGRRIITREAAIATSSHRDELHTILERAATAQTAAGGPPAAVRRVPMTQGPDDYVCLGRTHAQRPDRQGGARGRVLRRC
jgi:hypothetical protein